MRRYVTYIAKPNHTMALTPDFEDWTGAQIGNNDSQSPSPSTLPNSKNPQTATI
jgi:hypothetical protein